MNTEIELLEQYLIESGLTLRSDFRGCSLGEIRQVENAFGLTLPAFYVAFLHKMGRDTGRFMKGSSVRYPELLKLRKYAEELLTETSTNFKLGKKDFVFFVHQGYQFAYFQADKGDDPEVWCFDERWDSPQKKWTSLSAFFKGIASDEKP